MALKLNKLIAKTFTRQLDQADCGIACLLSILRLHGSNASFERLRELSGTDKVGTTMLGLYHAGQQLGFEVEGLRADAPANLQELTTPAILHVLVDNRLDHYVVYYPGPGPDYLIGDPGRGLQYVSAEELAATWVSRALLKLTPTDRLVSKATENKQKKQWLLALLDHDYSVLTVCAFLAIIAAVLNLATAFFYQKAIDELLPAGNPKRIAAGVGLLLLILLLRSIVTYGRGVLLNRQGFEFNNRLANVFYSSLLFLPQSFFDNRKTGELIARMNDTRRIQQTMSYLVGNVVVNVLGGLSALGYLFVISPRAGLVLGAAIPGYFLIMALHNRQVIAAQTDVMVSYALTESNYIDTIQGIDVIKVNNKQSVFGQLTQQIYAGFQGKIRDMTQVGLALSLRLEIVSTVLTVVVVGLSVQAYLGGQLKLGAMVAVFSITGALLPIVVNLASTNIMLQEAKIAFERMFEFSAIAPEHAAAAGLQPAPAGDPVPWRFAEMDITGLTFGFPGRAPILHNIALRLRRGEFAVLIGESGRGKSTFLLLMQKLYQPTSGSITVNGQPWQTLAPSRWRQAVGVVPQQAKMFNSSLLANITLDNSPVAEVISFCERYGFDAYFRAFPQAYSTMLGEGGINLSGGQQQLVALARALYKQPEILFLDEPTSAMDTRTEAFVLKLLHQLKGEMTIFMVTHRMHNLAGVDHVYLLQNGYLSPLPAPEPVRPTAELVA